jgi:hypothetical protein
VRLTDVHAAQAVVAGRLDLDGARRLDRDLACLALRAWDGWQRRGRLERPVAA